MIEHTNIPLVQNAEFLNIRTLTAGKYIYHFDLNGQCYTVRVLRQKLLKL